MTIPNMSNGPVGFVLDDNALQDSYTHLWRVPVAEIDASLRTVGHMVESATYLDLAEHLAEHHMQFGTLFDVVERLRERAEVAKKNGAAATARLAEVRAAQQEEEQASLAAAALAPARLTLTREQAEALGIDFDKLKKEGL